MVEAVIAMAVIAIVSATALSIAGSSNKNTRAAMQKLDAQYLAYDALECFKASQNEDDFYNAFRNCRSTIDAETAIEGNEQFAYSYILTDSKYLVFVKVEYDDIQYGELEDTFSIMIQDTKGNTVSQILNYKKLK